ncbi:DUF5988 family protein [Micromonospora sp. WMMD714]|uniref:DUF5988 family protein n=1 Tax=Micromonospora sp. WMMD714 TaxID=3016097 RepID=UPI00249A934E|nr:DUF5988 family protein [Micromonospora sp. WMMD714]WFE63720.1 DUF5988 family protein [Micromonospora sp. WMMD714]
MDDQQPTVVAVLDGGPTDIPVMMRTCHVTGDADRVKLPWLNGYEHFHRTAPGADGRTVFTWVGRTRIAE